MTAFNPFKFKVATLKAGVKRELLPYRTALLPSPEFFICGAMGTGSRRTKKGKCCLLGAGCMNLSQAGRADASVDWDLSRKFYSAVLESAKALDRRRLNRYARSVGYESCESLTADQGMVITYNDNVKPPKKIVARVFARAMAILGYTVNNPEAKHLKKAKAA